MITYSVAGVPMDDAAGRWRLLKGTLIAPGVSVRSVDTVVPGMTGSVPGAWEPLDAASLQLRMEVKGASDSALRANLAALLSVLAPSGDTVVTRTVDGQAQSTVGRGKSVTEPEYSAARKAATFTATLRLPGVFWRGASADWAKAAAVNGTAYEVATLAGCTASVADALLLITGPVSSPKVTDVASGEWVSLNLTLASGEKALIDCAAWSARRGSGVSFAGGGTVTSGSLVTSGGPYVLRLTPAMKAADPVDTWVRVSLSGSGFTSATALSVRAQPASMV